MFPKECKLCQEFGDRIKSYPEKRLQEAPQNANLGVIGVKIEHDMKSFLKVVLDEAKAECPLNKQLVCSYGDKPHTLKELQARQLKLLFEFNAWFEKWFGETP
jgi:hypothetical protein